MFYLFPLLNACLGSASLSIQSTREQHVLVKSPHHTILNLISKDSRFSLFSNLLRETPTLTKVLGDEAQKLTLFAPTNAAIREFERLTGNDGITLIENILRYHVVPWQVSLAELICTPTLPTLVVSDNLGGQQRVKIALSADGFALDGRAHVAYHSIPAINGRINAVDALLRPPQQSVLDTVLSLPSSKFSTMQKALLDSGLSAELGNAAFSGATVFAPSNDAFLGLGHLRLQHLFSQSGRHELRSLVAAHIVLNQTLYSNAYYGPQSVQADINLCPSGVRWFRLYTLDPKTSHQVQVVRLAGAIEMLINGFARVQDKDIICRDGVVHLTDRLLKRY